MSGIIVTALLAVSWILQLIGLLILLGSNASFYFKARRGKYHSVKKEFVMAPKMQVLPDDKQLIESNADAMLNTFSFSKMLYTNYRDSAIGVIFALVGVILGALVFTMTGGL